MCNNFWGAVKKIVLVYFFLFKILLKFSQDFNEIIGDKCL